MRLEKLHNEKLLNLYSSPNIIRMIKSRNMRWAGHVTHIGEMRNKYTILAGRLKGKGLSEDLGIDGRIMLKWILWK
jgi:hypothetical protein